MNILIKNNETGEEKQVSITYWNKYIKLYGAGKYTILQYFDDYGNEVSKEEFYSKQQLVDMSKKIKNTRGWDITGFTLSLISLIILIIEIIVLRDMFDKFTSAF